MLNSFVQMDAYCQNLSKKPYKIFVAVKPNSEKVGTVDSIRYFKSSTHVPFAISSLFLSTYCNIILVLNTWRRRWNTWTNVNVNWFHVRQNCQMLLNSFTVFSFIFWNLVVIKLKKTFCIFTSSYVSVLQLIANHVCSMISFSIY